MKFTINREALLKPLQLVAGVVERRQTLPVLSNVLMVVDGEMCIRDRVNEYDCLIVSDDYQNLFPVPGQILLDAKGGTSVVGAR